MMLPSCPLPLTNVGRWFRVLPICLIWTCPCTCEPDSPLHSVDQFGRPGEILPYVHWMRRINWLDLGITCKEKWLRIWWWWSRNWKVRMTIWMAYVIMSKWNSFYCIEITYYILPGAYYFCDNLFYFKTDIAWTIWMIEWRGIFIYIMRISQVVIKRFLSYIDSWI